MSKLLLWMLLLIYVAALTRLVGEGEWYLVASLIGGLLTQRDSLKKIWDEGQSNG